MKVYLNPDYTPIIGTVKLKEGEFLTEVLLGSLLADVFPSSKIRNQFKVGNLRVDYFVESIKTVVEFNGYRHYQLDSNIDRDMRLTKLCSELGYKLIFIPYFVQAHVIFPSCQDLDIPTVLLTRRLLDLEIFVLEGGGGLLKNYLFYRRSSEKISILR